MRQDQTDRDKRSDVIVFESDPMPEHTAVVGNMSATLFVSSSAVDTGLSDLLLH